LVKQLYRNNPENLAKEIFMQAKKVSNFMKARDAFNAGTIKSKRKAIEASGLSATTYYKYEKQFGDAPIQVNTPQKLNGQSKLERSIIDTHYEPEAKTTRDLVEENARLKDLVIQQLLKEQRA
jgi:hypothetical protein